MGVCDVSSSDSLCCPPSCTLQTQSLPALCECLRKAALDPRIKGVVVKVDPLATGWGKLQVQCGKGGWGRDARGLGAPVKGSPGGMLPRVFTRLLRCCRESAHLLSTHRHVPAVRNRRSCAGMWSTSARAASLPSPTWSGERWRGMRGCAARQQYATCGEVQQLLRFAKRGVLSALTCSPTA